MSLFGRWADSANFRGVTDLCNHFGVTLPHWQAFAGTVGDFRDDIRLLAAFPRMGLLAGISQTTFPDGSAFSPVQATQIGLVWRLARHVA